MVSESSGRKDEPRTASSGPADTARAELEWVAMWLRPIVFWIPPIFVDLFLKPTTRHATALSWVCGALLASAVPPWSWKGVLLSILLVAASGALFVFFGFGATLALLGVALAVMTVYALARKRREAR